MGLWGLNNASYSICCEIWHFYVNLLDGDLDFCPFWWHIKAQPQKLRNSPTVLLQWTYKPLNMWHALWSYYTCNLTLSNRLWGKQRCNLSPILNCKSIKDLESLLGFCTLDERPKYQEIPSMAWPLSTIDDLKKQWSMYCHGANCLLVAHLIFFLLWMHECICVDHDKS